MNFDQYTIQNGRHDVHAWGADQRIWFLRMIEPSRANVTGERPHIGYAACHENDFYAAALRADAAGTKVLDWSHDDAFVVVFDGRGREAELEHLWDELLTAFRRESFPEPALEAWATANSLQLPW